MIFADLNYIYKVNEDLKQDIFSRIPNDFSKLEQAIFIYNELCQKLNYSLNYYLDEYSNYEFFTNAKNLELIDGKKYKDVVCFTFDRIFLKLLFDKKIISDEDFWYNAAYSLMYNHIKPEHNIMHFEIDEKEFDVDATMGVFKSSDLSQSKFAGYKISGWSFKNCKTEKEAKEFEKALKKVQDLSVNKELQDNVIEYLKTKYENENFKKWSLDLRTNMYMTFVCEYGHFKEIQAISYAHKLKELMFSSQETNEYIEGKSKIAIQYIYNIKDDCPTILMFYNVDDELKVYQVDLKEPIGSFERRTIDEVKQKNYDGEFKYLTASKTIDQMAEPVKKAVELCKKEKDEHETKNL